MKPSNDPELEDVVDIPEEAIEELEIEESPPAKEGPSRFKRFVRSIFSHVVFAGIVIAGAGFFGYLNNKKIMQDVGNTVCAETMFGKYLNKQPQTSLASASKTAGAAATPAASIAGLRKMPAGATPTMSMTPAAAAANSNNVASDKAASSTAASAGTTSNKPQEQKESAAPSAAKPKAATGAPAPASPSSSSKDAIAKSAPPAQAPAKDLKTATQKVAAAQPPAAPPHPAAKTRSHANGQNMQGQMPPAKTLQDRLPRSDATNPTARFADPRRERATVAVAASSRQTPPARPASAKRQTLTLASALQRAREAQASGNANAPKIYRQMLRQFPNSPDFPGELGNIYYLQGKLSDAAEQYFETAQRLLKRNQPGRAACLIPVLRRIDPARAAALARQTRQACPTAQRR